MVIYKSFCSSGIPCSGPRLSVQSSEDDCIVSKEMMGRLGDFVRTGNPNSASSIHIWPEFHADHSSVTKTMSIREASFSKSVRDFRKDTVDFWAKYILSGHGTQSKDQEDIVEKEETPTVHLEEKPTTIGETTNEADKVGVGIDEIVKEEDTVVNEENDEPLAADYYRDEL